MADDRSRAVYPPRKTINPDDPYEIRHWAKMFRVSDIDIVIAVRNTGPLVDDVAFLLGRSGPPHPDAGSRH